MAASISAKRAAAFAEVSLVLAAFFWGTNYVAVKYVVSSIPPFPFVALRFVVAGAVIWGVLRILEPKSRLSRRDLLPMLGLGVLGVAVCQTTFAFGLSLTNASDAGLVFATSPVWGLLLGLALGQERPTKRGASGVGLSVLGVGIIFYQGLGADASSLVGDLLILASAVSLGSYTVLSTPLLRRLSPLAVAAYPMLFGGWVVFLFASPRLASVDWSSISVSATAAALYSTLFATAFAYLAWQRGVSRIGANRVLVYQYLITLVGVGSGAVLLGEDLGPDKIFGGVVILVGVYLARRQ